MEYHPYKIDESDVMTRIIGCKKSAIFKELGEIVYILSCRIQVAVSDCLSFSERLERPLKLR
jgi:hypothetical protein